MRSRIDFQLKPKERQALKLAEIREALVAAGYDTTAKQAAVLGVGRSTAWWLLNHDKRAGRKVEQYVEQKIRILYGHSEQRTQWFSEQFQRPAVQSSRASRLSLSE